MKFSTREDIEAPIEHVWAQISNFDAFERQALRRGAEIARSDSQGAPGLGSEWEVKFVFRGKKREVEARISVFDRPNTMRMNSRSGGLDGEVLVELVALSPRRTRLQLTMDLHPRNLSARLLVQSLRFAKANLSKRFSDRVYDFAQDVEGRYRNAG